MSYLVSSSYGYKNQSIVCVCTYAYVCTCLPVHFIFNNKTFKEPLFKEYKLNWLIEEPSPSLGLLT